MKTIFRVLRWTIQGAVALMMLSLVVLVAMNLNDQPPSPAAQAMRALREQRVAVPEVRNGYVFAMGFDAPQDADPRKIGAERIAWYNARLAKPGADLLSEPAHGAYDPERHRAAVISKLIETCKSPRLACAAALATNGQAVAAYVNSEGWRLARYRSLLANHQWQMTMKPDLRMVFPPYASVLDAQQLLLIKSWLLAGRGDGAAVKQLLAEDVEFWRMALASSDLLIDKMIASVALSRHFAFAQVVLRRFSKEQAMLAVPSAWHEPFSQGELSMKLVFSGEWAFAGSFMQGMAKDPGEFPILGNAFAERTESERMADRLAAHFLQPQDSMNKHAEFLLRLVSAMDVPLGDMQQALVKVHAIEGEMNHVSWSPYNPTGNYLFAKDPMSYSQYALRVSDLEGVRRAALLAVQVRSQDVKCSEVAARLAESALRNPYDDKPFAWNANERAVVFVGLAAGEKGRHAFLY